MTIGDIIFEQGIYKVKFTKTDSFYISHQSFTFTLLKNDVIYKKYSVATGSPYNYEKIKSAAIAVLKTFTI